METIAMQMGNKSVSSSFVLCCEEVDVCASVSIQETHLPVPFGFGRRQSTRAFCVFSVAKQGCEAFKVLTATAGTFL